MHVLPTKANDLCRRCGTRLQTMISVKWEESLGAFGIIHVSKLSRAVSFSQTNRLRDRESRYTLDIASDHARFCETSTDSCFLYNECSSVFDNQSSGMHERLLFVSQHKRCCISRAYRYLPDRSYRKIRRLAVRNSKGERPWLVSTIRIHECIESS